MPLTMTAIIDNGQCSAAAVKRRPRTPLLSLRLIQLGDMQRSIEHTRAPCLTLVNNDKLPQASLNQEYSLIDEATPFGSESLSSTSTPFEPSTGGLNGMNHDSLTKHITAIT